MKIKNNPLIVLNKKGQMAVFIVLIFQVLFVLFAMVINIGLIVHDKINLQNSVDLAAYYAAQRQAESLNVIAHQNYQIRQAWKLLAWRYFVLGTSSSSVKNQLNHPAVTGGGPPPAHTPSDKPEGCYTGFQEYKPAEGSSAPEVARWRCKKLPVICMYDIYPWTIKVKNRSSSSSSSDRYCRSLNLDVSILSVPSSVAGFISSVAGTTRQVKKLNRKVSDSCETAKYMQMVFASSILTAFDHEQSHRLRILYDVASGLSRGFDIDGAKFTHSPLNRSGTYQVFKKNLSYSNNNSVEDFKVFNSLSGKKPSNWLVPIVVRPGIIFTKFDTVKNGGCSAGSQTAAILNYKELTDTKRGYGEDAFTKLYLDYGSSLYYQAKLSVSKIGSHKQDEVFSFIDATLPASKTPSFLSVGVEKNPWYRVYAGVKASTAPRELFWIGKKVILTASAFASPFGGRIGPWYGKTWSSGQNLSNGVLDTDRVDKLLPPRDTLITGGASLTKSSIHEFIPNFSRFPGDEQGLFSVDALAAVQIGREKDVKFLMKNLVQSAFNYKDIADDKKGVFLYAQSTLSLSTKSDLISPRAMEVAAISPNQFDIAYYSVFPDARKSFMGRLAKLSADGNKILIRDDIGNYLGNAPDPGSQNVTNLRARIEKKPPFVKPLKGYFITDPAKLLTAWLPNGPYKYNLINTKAFQKCGRWVERGEAPVIGACAAGGRVGYSVKIISRDLLISKKGLSLGGANTSGSIENPPPSNF